MEFQFKDYQNIHHMLKETVDRYPNQDAYRWFLESGQKVSVTWTQFYEQVVKVSKSLIALGVKKEDKVNIISYTNYRWVLTDFGITAIGAVTVGIYHSNLAKDCKYIINHSDAVVVFVEDEIQLKKVLSVRDELPNVRKIIMLKGNFEGDENILNYDDFLALGKDVADKDLQKRIDGVKPQDTAGLIYTSGTTGVPKGAILSHDNITFTAQSVKGSTKAYTGDEVFLFLPLAHVFARTCVYASVILGATMTFNRDMDTLVDSLKLAQPHWFPSVPRIYEKVYSKVLSGAESKGGLALKIFQWACAVGEKVSDCKLERQPIPLLLNLQYKIATKLVFSKIQAALGGRVRWCISGAAPINASIAKFFHAAGVLVLEGLGMSENTSFTNLNRYDNYRFGWVGQPGPGIEQKIAEDGEVMFKGRNVMKGYYKMPEETAETITADGWLHTGDLGEIDSENFLRITGRKKDLIITAGGKNIAPSAIEGVIATSKYINQVCVIGDKRKYLSALITLDPDTIMEYADNNGITYQGMEDLVNNDQIKALVEAEIAEKNKEFASYETIKKITIVPEFTIENGMLTPTLKLKKNIAVEQYKDLIEKMYPGS